MGQVETRTGKSFIFTETVIITCLDNCTELLRGLICNLLFFQTILPIAVSRSGHVSACFQSF